MEEIGLLLYISILPQKIGKMLLNKNQLLLVLYMIKMLRKMEKEKPHYHVILSYKGNKSFEQIDEIARLLHASYSSKSKLFDWFC